MHIFVCVCVCEWKVRQGNTKPRTRQSFTLYAMP